MPDMNPNIILGSTSPIDAMSQMNQVASQGMQLQQQRQDFNDNQAVRNAYQQNTSVDPNGNVSLDRGGMLAGLAKTNPMAAQKMQQNFMELDMNRLSMQKARSERLSQLAGSATDQPSWNLAMQQAQQEGFDTSKYQNMPFDPNVARSLQAQGLTSAQQATNAIEQQKAAAQQQTLGIESQKLGLSLKENQNKNMQDTMAAFESMRGSDAAKKAENNLFSSAKINSLATLYKDPNNLSQAQVNLLHEELGTMASGGVPTSDMLKGLNPNTFTGKASETYGRFMNEPTPANAAAFVKQAKQYSDAIANDARNFLIPRYNSILEMKRGSLTSDQQKVVEQQIKNKLSGSVEPGTPFSQMGNQNQGSSIPEGSTKSWGGSDWKVQGGHWVKQPTQQANK